MNSERKIVGYDPNTGQPIYENSVAPDTQNIGQNNNLVQQQVGVTQEQNNIPVQPSLNNNQIPQQQNFAAGSYQNNQGFQQPNINMQKQQTKGTKNKKLILIPIFVVIIAVCIGVIFSLGNKDKPVSRTIMIYMVGSDLESRSALGTSDLNAINYSSDGEINVVLIAGGSENWYNNYINKEETSIYELKENGFTKVKQQDISNMGDSKVFSDFLTYVYNNYKTDKYDLIFWDHGGAIDGSEYDDISGDNLALSEMETGLKNSPFNNKNKLETVIFRTCLNGTIEVASTFSDYADYLVASEEVTMGATYTNVLNFINEIESKDSSIELGTKYIESYKRQMQDIRDNMPANQEYSIYSTYSITDLSKISQLKKSVNEFFADIDKSSNFNTISKVRANLYQYGSGTVIYDMVDLYNLVYKLQDLSPKKAKKVLSDLESAVVYNWATNSSSRGISIYFPYNGYANYKTKFLALYSGFEGFGLYKKFITNFYTIQNSEYSPSSYNFSGISSKSSEDGDTKLSDFTLELTDEEVESFAKASYLVFKDNKDGYFKPTYLWGEATLNGNTLSASIRDKQLKVISKTETEDNGTALVLLEKENTDQYIKYETYVMIYDLSNGLENYKIDNATMTLLYEKTSKKISMSNIVYMRKDDRAASIAVDLSQYDHIIFGGSYGYKITDEDGNYTGLIGNDEVFTGWETTIDDYEFELEKFDEGYDYYCVFAITDTHNNTSYSKLIKMN